MGMLTKISFAVLLISLFIDNATFSQCDINFGSLGSGIIVENGGTESATISYDIWNETTGSCSTPGGVADMTIDFATLGTEDVYGGTPLHTTNGTNYKVEYSGTGFRGTIPHGNIAATRSSPGDVRCYEITVTFAPHVNNIVASDFEVDLTSVNTGGTAFESTALVFMDRNGVPYGSFSYAGYYQSNPPPNTHPGIVVSCPNTPPLPNLNTSPWVISGTGVYFAAANTVDITNSCVPAGGSSGTLDNGDVLASDTGLPGNAGIGGFVFKVCLENVGTFTSDVALTAVSTTFTSTLNGFTINGQALPVKFNTFDASLMNSKSLLSFSTASETNNDYFTIERSSDGVEFDAIGEIKGAGNSSSELKYEFTDENPLPGINYYRIKQTDFDGKYSYTEIKSVRHHVSKITVSPLRTDGRLQITSTQDNYDVVLYNAAGQEVFRKNTLNGDQTIDIESLEAGIYFVKIVDQTFKVIKY